MRGARDKAYGIAAEQLGGGQNNVGERNVVHYGNPDGELCAVLRDNNAGASGGYGLDNAVGINGSYVLSLAVPLGLSGCRTDDEGVTLAHGEGYFMLVDVYLSGYFLTLVAVAGCKHSQRTQGEDEKVSY